MRPVKVAIAAALRADAAVARLIPPTQIHATERATLPVLPAVEIVGVSSERVDTGPMVSHRLSIEVTASHATENGADELLDGAVRAVRRRLGAAEHGTDPIALADGGEGVLISLGEARWSISASASAGVIRGASVSVNAVVGE